MPLSFSLAVIAALTLSSGSSACAGEKDPMKRDLDFVSYRVLKPDGTELAHYTSFMSYSENGKTRTTQSYLDTEDPVAMLARTLEVNSTLLPDEKTSITEGMSMAIAAEGYSRTETLPDGRKKIVMERNFANWWSNKGESTIERDGTMSGRMELRNKAGELVSIYVMQSHPATKAERAIFEKRLKAAKESRTKIDSVVDYSLKRSKSTYPEANPPASSTKP